MFFREASLLLDSPLFISPIFKEEILERGFAPLLSTLPPSLNKGRGSGG